MNNKKIDIILNLVDVFLITSPENFKYFTGSSIEGTLLISKNKKIVITDSRYLLESKNIKEFEIFILKKNYFEELTEILKNEKYENVGIEEKFITYDYYKKLKNQLKTQNKIKFIEISTIIEKLRMIKDENEIYKIKTAQRIAEKALEETLKIIKVGMTEHEVMAEINYNIYKLAEKISFDTIVLSGENTNLPHGVPSLRKIKSKDLILIDFGAVFSNYHSDITRMLMINSVSEEQKQIYNLVKKAKNEAINVIKEGVCVKEIDMIVRKVFGETYSKYFMHSTGHGIGLNIHEMPYISPKADEILSENMVFTIEPGLYIDKKFGIRIEDTVVVTKNGCVNLTNFSDDLIEI